MLSLDSELSFMYLARGLEMPLLLTDLFIISQDFPRECIENCFSCSQKRNKVGRVSSARKLLGMKIDTHTPTNTHTRTHTPRQLEYSSVPNKTEAFPLAQ